MFKKLIEAMNKLAESLHGCGDFGTSSSFTPAVRIEITEGVTESILGEYTLPTVACAETLIVRLKSSNGFIVDGVKYKYSNVNVEFEDDILYKVVVVKEKYKYAGINDKQVSK